MSVDVFIVVAFLALTLFVGLGHGRKVKTIKDYALGGRRFSTGALVATIVATYSTGSGFFITLSRTYTYGLSDLLVSSAIGISFVILSFVLIPRMAEFLGKTSVAEAMGDLYGQKVRVITAIAGSIGLSGIITVQFKVFGNMFAYFLHIPSYVAIIIAGTITTIYSAFGGIRAVTFTDILQFAAFGIIIPLVGFIIWSQFYHQDFTLVQAVSNPKFNISTILSFHNPEWLGLVVMFIYFVIPFVSAPKFQRVAMGSNIAQVKKAFIIAGMLLILIQIIIAWIPFLLHSINPSIPKSDLIAYIVENYSYVGLRGLIIVAIIAFAMSTADSYINATSVLFTNDICTSFTKKLKNELFVSRLFSIGLGIGAILLSLIEIDLLNILVLANSFFYPLVLPPFLLTVFGFRSSAKSVLIGMITGLFVSIIWKVLPISFVHVSQKMLGVLFAMFCNAFFLMSSHYLLKQPGGWVGIKDKDYYLEKQKNANSLRNKFSKWINEFNLMASFRKISPSNEMTYTALGV